MKILAAAVMLALSLLIVVEAGAQKKKKEAPVGTPKREDMPKYIEMLKKSQSAGDRAIAAEMIGKRGAIQVSDVKEALPLLQKSATKDIDPKVRKAAVTALGVIASDSENSVPPLTAALKDKNLEVQLSAVSALGAFGPDARNAVKDIRAFAKEHMDKKDKADKNIQKLVQDSLKKILAKPQ